MVFLRSERGADGAWRCVPSRLLPKGTKFERQFAELGIKTVTEAVKFSVDKNYNKQCMGTRTLIHRKFEETKGTKLEKLELGEYEWQTYGQIHEKIEKVAAGLISAGKARQTRIAIFAETRADWFIMAIGALRAGLTVVTLYANLNDDGIVHGITETKVDLVVSSYDLLPRLSKLLPRISNVKTIIVLEDQLEGMGNPTKLSSSVSFISFQALQKMGDPDLLKHHDGPKPEDIAIIMYTSGSTGNPKGVLLSHENIVHSILSYPCKVDVTAEDRYLAFLPLPHVMELSTEVCMMLIGCSIAYSSPFTLTSNSPKIMKGTDGDAKVAQPTYINVVPLLLDRIIKGVLSAVEAQGRVKAKIFHSALKYKMNDNTGFTSSLVDMIVFKKIRAELGGKIRFLISGGAPLSVRTAKMFSNIFGIDVKTGYGSTETTACTSCMEMDDFETCSAGSPNQYVSILLEDWEEGGYRTTDKPRPRGEVLVGGKIVAQGYLNLPKESAESFVIRNGVRYFRSGDIGEFDDRGVLYLIDRKKDLVKLQQGEYVALGGVETALKNHPLVDNICIFADPKQSYIVCIVVPAIEPFIVFCQSLGKTGSESLQTLCSDTNIVKAFLDELQQHGKLQNLVRTEIPKKLHLTADVWSPDNNLLTSAFKLRRKPLFDKYADKVATMYSTP